ncbi:DMT family transporter [Roseospira marina]|uniref:DMT family transporter n=1 Tax=Roseospira marina TaxID=140057 RepID=A0A5M6I7R1_9PROT|nr:DMT family transporter [Roseospira marina]KAA5604182.1 DMT family transporter [Roseospira marina]MBB4315724.1 drug/metabolite transporter (DMT)-like permease [Roseospira marina]MBB5088836.1 drug/metabolite transporter (DMT)-like permease [Roseospira marina]
MAPLATITRAMGVREWSLLLSLSCLWGGSFFLVGVAVREVPPLTIVAARVGLAAPVLWLAVAALGRPIPRDPSVWLAFAVMGVLNNVIPFSLIVWGQTQIPSGLASILNASTPLFAVFVAGALLADERFTLARILGVAIGFVGVALLIGVDALDIGELPVLPQVAVLGAAVSYAFAGVFGRRFRAWRVDPLVTAAGQVTASGAVMAGLAMALDRPWTLPMPGLEIVAALVCLAVLCTALAYGLYFRILETAGATNVLLVTFLVPVTAILLGVFVLDETLRASHLGGMALIGVGLLVMDGRAWTAVRRRLRSNAGPEATA